MRIKKFDPTGMKAHRIFFLIGKRHTGISVLMIDLLALMPKPDFVIGMTPTDDTVAAFKEFIPDTCIFSRFSQTKLEKMLQLQRELIRRGKYRSVLLVMDDCLYEKNVLKSTAMRDLFMNGRHLNCGLICAAQYMMDITPELRTNIDYVFSMRENIISNRTKLWKYFYGQFARYDEFARVMDACTQNYSSLVMDNTVSSTASTDSVFWYRARTDIPTFQLARPSIWKLSDRHRRSEDDQREEERLEFERTCATGAAQHVTLLNEE